MLNPPGQGARSTRSSNRRKTQESPDDQLRKLQRAGSNKNCADCGTKLPQCVNLTVGSFVCLACSGIHRELSMRVKGIGASTFTQEEVDRLKQTSNDAVNQIYMARFNPNVEKLQQPTNNFDLAMLRLWIQRKYRDKAWYSAEPQPTRVEIPPKKAAPPTSAGTGQDLLGFSAAPAAAPANNNQWDAFGGSSQQKSNAFPADFGSSQTKQQVQSQQQNFANFGGQPQQPQQQQQNFANFGGQPQQQQNFANFGGQPNPPPQQQQNFANFGSQQPAPHQQNFATFSGQPQQSHQDQQQHPLQQQNFANFGGQSQQPSSQQGFANFAVQSPQPPSQMQQPQQQPPPQEPHNYASFGGQQQPPPQQQLQNFANFGSLGGAAQNQVYPPDQQKFGNVDHARPPQQQGFADFGQSQSGNPINVPPLAPAPNLQQQHGSFGQVPQQVVRQEMPSQQGIPQHVPSLGAFQQPQQNGQMSALQPLAVSAPAPVPEQTPSQVTSGAGVMDASPASKAFDAFDSLSVNPKLDGNGLHQSHAFSSQNGHMHTSQQPDEPASAPGGKNSSAGGNSSGALPTVSIITSAAKEASVLPATKKVPTEAKYDKGASAIYTDSSGNKSSVKVLKVHLDDELVPFYTIQLPDGREKQTDDGHLSEVVESEEMKQIRSILIGFDVDQLRQVLTFVQGIQNGSTVMEKSMISTSAPSPSMTPTPSVHSPVPPAPSPLTSQSSVSAPSLVPAPAAPPPLAPAPPPAPDRPPAAFSHVPSMPQMPPAPSAQAMAGMHANSSVSMIPSPTPGGQHVLGTNVGGLPSPTVYHHQAGPPQQGMMTHYQHQGMPQQQHQGMMPQQQHQGMMPQQQHQGMMPQQQHQGMPQQQQQGMQQQPMYHPQAQMQMQQPVGQPNPFDSF